MILLLICIAIIINIGIIGSRKAKNTWRYEMADSDWKKIDARVDGFVSYFFVGLIIVGGAWLVSQVTFGAANIQTNHVTYSQPLVSINDGTGVEGHISGGLFVMSGSVNDTQHFSYYRDAGNGSFVLEKRPAPQSTIWQDATPETARLDVTDALHPCKTTWYSIFCFITPNEFVHADFHVPPNSIKNNFTLDAE